MSYKPDEKDWMAYLYGELEGEDKEKFDQYLLTSPEARQELQKFQNLRQMLASAEDKEVIAPPIFVDSSSKNGRLRFLWNSPYLNTIISIAASLLLIILVGKLTGTQISFSGNEFRMSFGAAKIEQTEANPRATSQPDPSMTPEQVQEMINNALAQNNVAMQTSWADNQKKLDASIRQNLAVNSNKIDQLVRQASSASQQQVRDYVAGIRNENAQMVKDYFQLTSNDQKKYLENLLVDFAQYLQQQRNNDLQVVQTRLNSLEQNTDLFKQETEQILSSIITSVGATPGTKEIKN
jgi:hypothetical protein